MQHLGKKYKVFQPFTNESFPLHEARNYTPFATNVQGFRNESLSFRNDSERMGKI